MSGEARTGPIAYRQFVLPQTCQVSEGHSHNYDHTTFVHRGRLLVIAHTPEGVETARVEYGAGEFVEIPSGLHHTIKALEDNTVYYCIFSHRDFDGLVSQRYVGNSAAYD